MDKPLTWSNAAKQAFVLLTDATANPTRTRLERLIVVENTCVQLVPSGDVKPVTVLPERTSRTQYGAMGPLWAAEVAVAPAFVRYTYSVPFTGVRAMRALLALLSSVSRIITPAFAQLLLLPSAAIRARISQLPSTLS